MKIQKKRAKHEFWITNISRNKDISLGDLRLTIRKGESRNLLDSKHYSYTLDELEKSAESGSIKIKSKFIKVRNLPPLYAVNPGKYQIAKQFRISKARNFNVDVTKPKFEELDFENEQDLDLVVEDEADIIHNDNVPILAVDKQYSDKDE